MNTVLYMSIVCIAAVQVVCFFILIGRVVSRKLFKPLRNRDYLSSELDELRSDFESFVESSGFERTWCTPQKFRRVRRRKS